MDESDKEKAIFEIYMPDNSWLGLVLGDSGMAPGADMIQIKADGINSRVYDKFSQGYISPPQDPEKNLLDNKFRFFEGGVVRFTLTRELDTGDAADFLIPVDNEFDLGWAVNTETSDLLQKHTKAGAMRARLNVDGTDAFEPTKISAAGATAIGIGSIAIALASIIF